MRHPVACLACVGLMALGLLAPAGADPSSTESSSAALLLIVPCPTLARAGRKPQDTISPVKGHFKGSAITGLAHLHGELNMTTVPCPDRAVVRLILQGCVVAHNNVQRQVLRLQTEDRSELCSVQDLSISAAGLEVSPPRLSMPTRSNILVIETDRPHVRDAFLRSTTRLSACLTPHRINRFATEAAEQITREETERQTQEHMVEANRSFRRQFLEPLGRWHIAAEQLHFSSTDSAFQFDIHERPGPAAPPAGLRPADAWLLVHESLANRVLQEEFSGRTLTRDDLGKTPGALQRWLKLPDSAEDEEQPWSMALAKMQPITVTFARDQVVLTVRAKEFASGERTTSAMNVTGRWNIVNTPAGVRLERAPDLEIYPPGFVPGSGQRLPARIQSYRTLLNRRLGRLFPREIAMGPVPLSELMGTSTELALRPGRMLASDGWLLVEWQLTP